MYNKVCELHKNADKIVIRGEQFCAACLLNGYADMVFTLRGASDKLESFVRFNGEKVELDENLVHNKIGAVIDDLTRVINNIKPLREMKYEK